VKEIEAKIDSAIEYLQCAEKTDYIGEAVSQLEHALQAAYFAEQSGHADEVILACLFHDIGHFASTTQQFQMADLGVVNHEWIGAKLIYDLGFSKKVALLIGYHVDAKRYLAGKKPAYFERLSSASKQTLAFQGGPMSEVERNQFENHPYFKEILQVRINDEKAKELGLSVPNLDSYRLKIKDHIQLYDQSCGENLTLSDFVDNQWVDQLKRHLNYDAAFSV
jgi:predicted HD phosphohydrolase